MIHRILLLTILVLAAPPVMAEPNAVAMPPMSDAEISEAVARLACDRMSWSNWRSHYLGRNVKAMVT